MLPFKAPWPLKMSLLLFVFKKRIFHDCLRFIEFLNELWKRDEMLTSLTLDLIETHFDAFANRADPDQAALVKVYSFCS